MCISGGFLPPAEGYDYRHFSFQRRIEATSMRFCKYQFGSSGPHRALDIEALARVAAMNRTKLRSSFEAFGATLSDYRTALLLQKADLKDRGSTVEQAAHRAGYASASSFIVAYKRQYGVCPGDVVRQRLGS